MTVPDLGYSYGERCYHKKTQNKEQQAIIDAEFTEIDQTKALPASIKKEKE